MNGYKIIKFIFIILILISIFFILTKNKYKYIDNENFKNPIYITFITDNNYVPYVRTSIRSIISNKNPKTHIQIFVVGVDLSNNAVLKLENETRENVNVNVLKISISDLQGLSGGTAANPGVSRADNAKFFLVSIFKNINKIIYLDGDTIVLNDLSEMYNTEIGNNYAAVVDDWQSGWTDGSKKRYFNNGIMLLNLKKMREDDISNKLIQFKLNDKVHRFVTQDAFNNVLFGKTIFLSLVYDTFAPEYDSDLVLDRIKETLGENYDAKLYNYKSADEFRKNVVIIHYCGWGNKKPWKKVDLYRKSSVIWYKYAPLDFWIDYLTHTKIFK